ncbi:hypothetical protein WISP_33055 [Willisornis vidua]|uniref:Uncharacterized protein n=1 Tax=Willisornis vidua TaxID=1566151 RepID=A0ABQ9DQI8_9PASS|nr:hypothetical protein WISP_33055 [Willisornis vidua]
MFDAVVVDNDPDQIFGLEGNCLYPGSEKSSVLDSPGVRIQHQSVCERESTSQRFDMGEFPWGNDFCPYCSLSPEDIKLEQMGNALILTCQVKNTGPYSEQLSEATGPRLHNLRQFPSEFPPEEEAEADNRKGLQSRS